MPEEYGGSPVSCRATWVVTKSSPRRDEPGRRDGRPNRVAKLLSLFGTEEQKRTYLPRLATGELRATMALTEPGGGSDLQNMSTIAVPAPTTGDQRFEDLDQQRPTFRASSRCYARPTPTPPLDTAAYRYCSSSTARA